MRASLVGLYDFIVLYRADAY